MSLRVKQQNTALSRPAHQRLMPNASISTSPGAKKGCDHTVMRGMLRSWSTAARLACLTLAASVEGRASPTIEGLAAADGNIMMQ